MKKLNLQKEKLIIAGPCSAETEDQLLETAIQIAEKGQVDVLRAGVWKPRTNPGGFEGAGTKALAWLNSARSETGLAIGTEVATQKHVEDALHFDLDLLWIGARTTVNPFSVQEIADALKGTKIPVLIKNPINPDLKLWIGAVERLQNAGIEEIGLIHRGFSSYKNIEFRNAPMWQIPIEMKRLFPHLPMICDPSHICGKREGILEVSQKSLDLAYDGLMIESHIRPEEAWTDAAQQFSPRQLNDMLEQLEWKISNSTNRSFTDDMSILREQINQFDDQLMSLLNERMGISESIGKLKDENKVTVLQSNRWSQVLERMLYKSKQTRLSEDFVQGFMELLHVESIRIQNEKKSVFSV